MSSDQPPKDKAAAKAESSTLSFRTSLSVGSLAGSLPRCFALSSSDLRSWDAVAPSVSSIGETMYSREPIVRPGLSRTARLTEKARRNDEPPSAHLDPGSEWVDVARQTCAGTNSRSCNAWHQLDFSDATTAPALRLTAGQAVTYRLQ